MPAITPQPPEVLTPKQWGDIATTQAHLHHQRQIIPFLLWAYGLFSAATFAIFFLQGFHAWGFQLDLKVLLCLSGATIGEIGGLLLLTFRVVFRK
ncbi:MAG TPA: hypothetical protein VFC39_12335 [Acidobacteriaceae bacterium]|nr:hypothetical protein [Acidobacteriaceae bacterium]